MRKNSQLLIAYTVLFTSAIGAVCYDSHVRSMQVPGLSEAEQKAADRRAKGGSATRIVAIPTAPTELVAEVKRTSEPTETSAELPRGVFLTKETMKLQSSDGQTRELAAGTQVMLVRRDKGKMKVQHNGSDYLVDEDQITRNVRAVEKLIASRKG